MSDQDGRRMTAAFVTVALALAAASAVLVVLAAVVGAGQQ